MTVHYFDPSAWIKRHFEEVGSEAVNALFRTPVEAACCRLGLVEMIATIARKSWRESLDKGIVGTLLDNVRADFSAFRVIPVDELCIGAATELVIRHRLRTMDAVHLACALTLRPHGDPVVVSADSELLAAAANEGLSTLNPMDLVK